MNGRMMPKRLEGDFDYIVVGAGTAGCIVVPVSFYDAVVAPSLGKHRGVVYVLPENSPVQAMFGVTQVGLATP